MTKQMILTADAAARKALPISTGVLDYFPRAVAEVARVSKAGSEQHHPGKPLHWDKTKSMDHADCIGRHLIDRGSLDTDGMRHSAKLAWRALALLELELEAAEHAGTALSVAQLRANGDAESYAARFPIGSLL